jgi:threonine/homoserine/homoserine lactone efflux protein
MDLGAAFLAAVAVWLAALVAPGPDFAATLHAAAGGSRRSGLGVAAGVTVGMTVWATASLFGLHTLLRALSEVASAVRLVGAAYLVYVGGRLLWAAGRGGAPAPPAVRPRSLPRAVRHGLLTNLANPKALALFGSLFAVLVPPAAPPVVQPGPPGDRRRHHGRMVRGGGDRVVGGRRRPPLPPPRAGRHRPHRRRVRRRRRPAGQRALVAGGRAAGADDAGSARQGCPPYGRRPAGSAPSARTRCRGRR